MEKQKETRLTIDELRKFKGLENLSDEEAEQAISAIEKLTVLIIRIMKREEYSRDGKVKTKSGRSKK